MLATLIELQRLKGLDRTGWPLRGLPSGTESVAAHSFGVSAAAMLLADRLVAQGVNLDMERVLRMAMIHDWAEARIGDMPRTATEYFGAEARRQAELAAFTDIVQELGRPMYLDLFEDYEQRRSLEARLVKAADVIDLLVQVLALEKAGYRGLNEFWEVAENADFRLEGTVKETVAEVLRTLVKARNDVRAGSK